MSLEPLLHRLRDACAPPTGAQERVLRRVQERMAAPKPLTMLHAALSPSADTRDRVWSRIRGAITSPAESVLQGARNGLQVPGIPALLPALARLRPEPEHRAHPVLRWGAAVAVIALLAPLAPALLLAPRTSAESSVIMRPVSGDVFVVHPSTLEPLTEERTMETTVRLRTGNDGALTVVAHDDYVVRLDRDADVEWHDITDRPEPSIGPTLTLRAGRMWIRADVPSYVRGITVATVAGMIVVNEGSADIALSPEGMVTVRAFDRTVRVVHEGRTITLAAGEATMFSHVILPSAYPLRSSAFTEGWVARNLGYDAAHRKEIAQWQQERRAAQAGILPTSSLYTAKRVMEKVVEFTALSEEEKVHQRLAQADTRLNEAAALLQEGDTEHASEQIEEYRVTLLALATGTGDSVTQFLIRQKVAEDTAGFAAALPTEEGYALKKAALEIGASLPENVISEAAVLDSLVVDKLASLDEALVNGDMDHATAMYRELAEQGDANIAPVVRKQEQAVFRRYALALREEPSVDQMLLAETEEYLPAPSGTLPLSAKEISKIVGGILDNTVGIYSTSVGLTNSMNVELKLIRGTPDEIRVLQQLRLNLMPRYENLVYYVDVRLRELRNERREHVEQL